MIEQMLYILIKLMEMASIHILQKIEKHLVKIEGNIGKIEQKQKKGKEGKLGDVNVNLPIFTKERFVMLDDDFKEYLNDEFGRIFP